MIFFKFKCHACPCIYFLYRFFTTVCDSFFLHLFFLSVFVVKDMGSFKICGGSLYSRYLVDCPIWNVRSVLFNISLRNSCRCPKFPSCLRSNYDFLNLSANLEMKLNPVRMIALPLQSSEETCGTWLNTYQRRITGQSGMLLKLPTVAGY